MATKAVQQEVRHIHDLIILRDLLADRGAATDDLRRYNAAIGAARRRLAKLARADALDLAA